ncbi:MAG: M1 family metallopeptidase [Bacteroidia bacterium]|nr:M1 family metallopeptidase [Bacteroidia bacterium]
MWYRALCGGRKVGLLLPLMACAQWDSTQVLHGRPSFSRADTLLGSLSPYRNCYDVVHYALRITVNPSSKSIQGEVVCTFRWKGGADTMQVDLAEELSVREITVDGQSIPFRREKGTRAIWVVLRGVNSSWGVGSLHRWRVLYRGKPRTAPRPPWDGGVVWGKTPFGEPWIGVSCQGIGASVWWPLKDHLSDEPDSLSLTVCVPPPLQVVANGQLSGVYLSRSDTCYSWRVSYPINSYNVTFYAAPRYVTVEDTFHSQSGRVVPLRFSLLSVHTDKAAYLEYHSRKVLRAFEHYFGPFPPQKDGFALVESPYYGMEHQSAIAYGNRFQPDRIWGFDYIILHETGHEWWGNHVTASDNADLWIQEGFCTYAEALYIEYYEGYKSAIKYLLQQRPYIQNRLTIQGPYGVNVDQTHNTDIYYKMAWVLHTLRSRVDNDSLWFSCLRAIQDSFSFRTLSGGELIAFMSRKLGEDLFPFFRAYLYHLRPPVISYKILKNEEGTFLVARWICAEKDFKGPMEFLAGENRLRFELTQVPQRFMLPPGVETISPDRNRFFVMLTQEP